MTRRLAVTVGVAIVVVVAAVAWFRVLSVPAVETITVAPAEFRARAFGTGTVEARVYVEIGSKITGRVVKLAHDQGDVVEKGTLLAVLENEELQQQRQQADFGAQRALQAVQLERAALLRARATLDARKASLGKAVANAELARVTHDRFNRLYERELIARQDLDVRATERQTAEAEVLNTRAEITALEAEVRRSEVAVTVAQRDASAAGAGVAVTDSRLRDASVYAPFSGLILTRPVEPGAVVVPGVPLFKMVDPRTVWVRINFDESLLGNIRVGQRAEISVRSRPGQTFAGEVVRIREESDRVAEELSVDIKFVDTPPRLRIGEQAEATVITRDVPHARVVPAPAVVREGKGHASVVVADQGRAQRRPVTIGARDPKTGDIEVASGVNDGEQIVVGPAPFPSTIKDGQALRLAKSAAR
ncbi:MAG TPA: efflux RND transporter periplasmic adaptor subunit [Gemmatimonadaceae bacterium]